MFFRPLVFIITQPACQACKNHSVFSPLHTMPIRQSLWLIRIISHCGCKNGSHYKKNFGSGYACFLSSCLLVHCCDVLPPNSPIKDLYQRMQMCLVKSIIKDVINFFVFLLNRPDYLDILRHKHVFCACFQYVSMINWLEDADLGSAEFYHSISVMLSGKYWEHSECTFCNILLVIRQNIGINSIMGPISDLLLNLWHFMD